MDIRVKDAIHSNTIVVKARTIVNAPKLLPVANIPSGLRSSDNGTGGFIGISQAAGELHGAERNGDEGSSMPQRRSKSFASDKRAADAGKQKPANGNGANLGFEAQLSLVLANRAEASTQLGEDNIRKAMLEADVVDCMISLPSQLFCSTHSGLPLVFCPQPDPQRQVTRPAWRSFVHPRANAWSIGRRKQEPERIVCR
jgi:hypothetical protein